MHISSWALVSLITTAAAYELKVNYYSDGGCEDYILSLNPTVDWGQNPTTCYDYEWNGINSANIANCQDPAGGQNCYCVFYTEPGCEGNWGVGKSDWYDGDNCASNWGQGFKSMVCQYATADGEIIFPS